MILSGCAKCILLYNIVYNGEYYSYKVNLTKSISLQASTHYVYSIFVLWFCMCIILKLFRKGVLHTWFNIATFREEYTNRNHMQYIPTRHGMLYVIMCFYCCDDLIMTNSKTYKERCNYKRRTRKMSTGVMIVDVTTVTTYLRVLYTYVTAIYTYV